MKRPKWIITFGIVYPRFNLVPTINKEQELEGTLGIIYYFQWLCFVIFIDINNDKQK